MRTNVVVVRDHSGSMSHLAKKAMADYNLLLSGVRQSSVDNGQTTMFSVVECGVGPMGSVRTPFYGVPVAGVMAETFYAATGGSTPLFDSVGEAIAKVAHGADDDTSFLVMVITDGHENSSKLWNARTISQKINELQKTDRWTFAFRVPRGSKYGLVALGIPEGNVLEWEQTEASLAHSTEQTVSGINTYFRARSSGVRSSSSFYANIGDVSPTAIKSALTEETDSFKQFIVPKKCEGMQIEEFCLKYGPGEYKKGQAFYQLTKTEKVVQDYKVIVIRDRTTSKIYSGPAARSLLGLPPSGDVRLTPGRTGNYDVFIQSTSVNRKLVGDTSLLYTK